MHAEFVSFPAALLWFQPGGGLLCAGELFGGFGIGVAGAAPPKCCVMGRQPLVRYPGQNTPDQTR
jgi:hypothetical protein